MLICAAQPVQMGSPGPSFDSGGSGRSRDPRLA